MHPQSEFTASVNPPYASPQFVHESALHEQIASVCIPGARIWRCQFGNFEYQVLKSSAPVQQSSVPDSASPTHTSAHISRCVSFFLRCTKPVFPVRESVPYLQIRKPRTAGGRWWAGHLWWIQRGRPLHLWTIQLPGGLPGPSGLRLFDAVGGEL